MQGIPLNTDNSPSVILEMIFRLKIKDVMTRNVRTSCKDCSMREIQKIMKEERITGVPITDGSRLCGIVSMEDVLSTMDRGLIEEPANKHMTRNVIVLEEDMPLSFAINYMDKYHYGRFPVLNMNKELVGIITSRDIVNHLLLEMNREMTRLEKMLPLNEPEARGSKEMSFICHRYDFENAGKASTEIKKALKKRNIDRKIIRRVAVASYELEINQVVHSLGGRMTFNILPDSVTIEASDRGPGIENLEEALTEGFSTANDWIRSLGFGAGMGLANVKRVSDEFNIASVPGEGTTVKSMIYTHSKEEGAKNEG
ncbi:CBS domain-containing protein [Oceanispirochaeta crateris]|jgi:CBS domain-containing protein/anti-sigma regulatory factor (Ser/Thr protein kinase)|uniref:CBS domain-containing protein n=1 Tax=Oceanispirochaeta crateris TaxID=2518645 RepID=A0A5C1QQ03_9SPIO|nr:CBS domain-containing protein [Oceanispirochaeta crateris]QEN09279.1 CBS domain-containing protein [Oceanispirochaeta crateris]